MMSLKSLRMATLLVFLPATFSITAVNGTCTSGFLDSIYVDKSSSDLVTLPDSSLPYTNPLFHFTQWIFPDITFTCSTSITSWRLRVNDSLVDSGTTHRPIPHITTWRLQNSFGTSDSYILHSITNDSQGTVTITEGGVYVDYTPSQPISVQAGDIVGITMPPADDERMKRVRPLFLKLSEGNSSLVSCTRLEDSQYFFLADGMCLNHQQQQFLYVPLLTPITSEIVPTIHSESPLMPTSDSIVSLSPSSSLNPTPTIINVAPMVTISHSVRTVPPSPVQDDDRHPTTTGLDNGLVIGILIAGGTLFILAMMSIVIFVAIVCLKQKQVMPSVSNDLQQETLKERESAAPHQIQSEDYEILSELKSNSAYIPSYTQQVLIETKENVAYHCSPIENQHYYSNDQYDYEEIQDF